MLFPPNFNRRLLYATLSNQFSIGGKNGVVNHAILCTPPRAQPPTPNTTGIRCFYMFLQFLPEILKGILGVHPRLPLPFISGDSRNPNHRAPNQQPLADFQCCRNLKELSNIPRKEHTPDRQPTVYDSEFLSYGDERGSLGYAPFGVCWGSLRRKKKLSQGINRHILR